nr:hypothetical protein [uncultured Blautia sp.]
MKQKETQQETMSKEKRVVFFEGKSWYHRTKELQDDLTTKYGKKGGFETPEEAEKSPDCKNAKDRCDAWGLSGILV